MRDAFEWWLLVIGAIAALTTAIVKTWRNLRRMSRMVDVFLGYDDHPGIDERVANLEERLAHMERLLSIHLSTAHGVSVEQLGDAD